jgi:hypothetical protein
MVLMLAILVNFAANLLNLMTWYEFIKFISANGMIEAFSSLSVLSALFLFVIYPFVLGLIGFWGYKIIF